jgi:hypothetical protein
MLLLLLLLVLLLVACFLAAAAARRRVIGAVAAWGSDINTALRFKTNSSRILVLLLLPANALR